jgi:hypothetical protein
VVVVDLTLYFDDKKLENGDVCELLDGNGEQSATCCNEKKAGTDIMEIESDTEACTPQKGMVPTRTIAPKNTRGHVRTPLVSPLARFAASPDSVLATHTHTHIHTHTHTTHTPTHACMHINTHTSTHPLPTQSQPLKTPLIPTHTHTHTRAHTHTHTLTHTYTHTHTHAQGRAPKNTRNRLPLASPPAFAISPLTRDLKTSLRTLIASPTDSANTSLSSPDSHWMASLISPPRFRFASSSVLASPSVLRPDFG